MQRARIVLVGTGRIGTVHLDNILGMPRAQLVGIVEVVPQRKDQFAAKYGCPGYLTPQDALADDSNPFEGVLVCTPTPTHYEVVKTALLGGKHVFCEKPISLNIEESDECYELAKSKGLHLLVAFQRRYDPSFVKLKETVDKGSIGTLQKVRTVSRDNPVPSIEYLSTSGGIYHDCLSHDIDLIRWVTGKEPVEVFSYGTCFIDAIHNIDDFDNVDCILKFDNGILATIDVSRKACYGYDQTITCLGDAGMVTAENRQPTTVVLATAEGITEDPYCYSFPTRYKEAYTFEIEHYIDLLLGVTDTPKLQHADVHNNAIIAHALEESARKGHAIRIEGLI
jgi:myo-inositol 2-dehydrogenase/D-chiro-inositol 1-dehydrogenase